MSKTRSTMAVCVVSLFAAVALFPSLAGIEQGKAGKLRAISPCACSVEVLVADGGEPQPPIPIPPSLGFGS